MNCSKTMELNTDLNAICFLNKCPLLQGKIINFVAHRYVSECVHLVLLSFLMNEKCKKGASKFWVI